jgi:hypothetical protein
VKALNPSAPPLPPLQVPKLHDVGSVKSISIDVRPALDSADALLDRAMRMPFRVIMGQTIFRPLPFFAFTTPTKPAPEVRRTRRSYEILKPTNICMFCLIETVVQTSQ